MNGRRALRGGALAAVSTLLIAACGPTSPQAPLLYAKKLDSATSGISTACGEATQVTAFPGNHGADLVTLEVTAASSARKLAGVFVRNPSWIYQGETIRQIVHDSVAMLGSCGLPAAERQLVRATRGS